MSRRNRQDRQTEGDVTTAEDAGTVQAAASTATLTPSARRLDAAHKHLDMIFCDASGEQVDGRKFFGRVTVSIVFADGEATDVLVSKEARDRCSGGTPDAKAWTPGV